MWLPALLFLCRVPHTLKISIIETVNSLAQTPIAFINEKSPILDLTCNDLVASGIKVLFCSENIRDGLSRLSTLKELPKVCIIDLDFYDDNVLAQLQELRTKYPNIQLIAHSDNNSEKVVKSLLELGFGGYLLIGSDADDFKKTIEGVCTDKKYFRMGVAKTVQEHFGRN